MHLARRALKIPFSLITRLSNKFLNVKTVNGLQNFKRFNYASSLLYFTTTTEQTINSKTTESEKQQAQEPKLENTEKLQFKAETKKLLDIVAKSLYTDKDVFVRELLSNASDALEKCRFLALTKQGNLNAEVPSNLQISITANNDKKLFIVQDTGCGMTRQELIDNLGTIARSGSQAFIKQIKEQPQNQQFGTQDNIIGQFGVGFYSSFIVGDKVEVISKSDSESDAYIWVSDGSGTFEISKYPNFDLQRGTRITVHLKPECQKFADKEEIKKVIQRYSNFINYPLLVNEEKCNLVQAIWSRSKSDITPEEYTKFWEYISNTKVQYKYKLHYSTDAPLSIKALLYFPSTHMEKYGLGQEEMDVNLYSRKILIKPKCRDILPNYLRFIKGAVDCEDLPLNLSRENYQDSALIAKLKNTITKRLLKLINEEAEKNPADYLKWYQEFQFFFKEGLAMDPENTESIFKLCRYQVNWSDQYQSIDDYIAKLPKNSQKIYYLLAPNRDQGLLSPYMEPFKGTETPVLFLQVHIDEMVFRQMNQYKGLKFVNIESDFEEISKDQKDDTKKDVAKENVIPEEEITPFCMWIKNELQPIVSKVQVSKRLVDSPAVIISQLSSGMRQMMMMLEKTQNVEANKNLTLEINPKHEILFKLNKIRKTDQQTATLIARQVLDNCLVTSGIQVDHKELMSRINKLMIKVLDKQIDQTNSADLNQQAQREEVKIESNNKTDQNVEVILDKDGNPIVQEKSNKK